ncbi:hypothetical protein BGW80DRAFT_1317498 [Lactifluus volemus]|nr:hypothetical protein BGW80DRAFT_1317498 [Lactifluus volemus]
MVRVKPPPSGRALPRKGVVTKLGTVLHRFSSSHRTRSGHEPGGHQTREAKAKKWKGGPGRNRTERTHSKFQPFLVL